MIGTTLGSLVDMLRMECGMSTQPGQGVAVLPKLQYLCRRTQEWFYDDYNWPHLRFNCDIPINIGQNYYSFPAQANPFRVCKIETYYNNRWYPIEYGVGPAEYNLSDPMQNMAQDPIRRWRRLVQVGTQCQIVVSQVWVGTLTVNASTDNATWVNIGTIQNGITGTFSFSTTGYSFIQVVMTAYTSGAANVTINQVSFSPNNIATAVLGSLNATMSGAIENFSGGQQKFEIWPVPASTSLLRFEILQNLPSFIATSDPCVIDDKLIVLTAASEYMTSLKDPGSKAKSEAAAKRYLALKGNYDDTSMKRLGGEAPPMQEPDGNFIDRWWPLMAKGS